MQPKSQGYINALRAPLTFRLMHFKFGTRNRFFEMVRDLNKRKGKNMRYTITINKLTDMIELKYALQETIRNRMQQALNYKNTRYHDVYIAYLRDCKKLGKIYLKILKQLKK